MDDDMISLENVYGRVIYKSHIWGYIILHLLKPFVALYFATILLLHIYNSYRNNSNDKEAGIDNGKRNEEISQEIK